MQKILVLSTSPRKGGNTDTLCDELIRGALEAGAQCEKIRTDELTINKCTACGVCRAEKGWGDCVIRDDFPALLEKMQSADTVVFASPVYFYDVAAQLKLIIDRCYCAFKHITFKNAAFIAAMTGTDEEKLRHIVESFELYLHCLGTVSNAGVVTAAGVREPGEVRGQKAYAEAYELGKRLASLG